MANWQTNRGSLFLYECTHYHVMVNKVVYIYINLKLLRWSTTMPSTLTKLGKPCCLIVCLRKKHPLCSRERLVVGITKISDTTAEWMLILCIWNNLSIFMPPPGQTWRQRHYVLILSVRLSVCPFVCSSVCDILKTNEPILMPIATSGPRRKDMKWSNSGDRR